MTTSELLQLFTAPSYRWICQFDVFGGYFTRYFLIGLARLLYYPLSDGKRQCRELLEYFHCPTARPTILMHLQYMISSHAIRIRNMYARFKCPRIANRAYTSY